MTFDPRSLDLDALFDDPDMFDSRDDFRAAGFDVLGRSNDSKIMAGSHASAQGVLFKKYSNDVALKEQYDNYASRIEGARKLHEFIDARGLRHVVVPQKWFYELPDKFSSRKRSSHVLVVERLKILDDVASERKYFRIDEDVLRELCRVLFEFRGLDSNSKNIPFTEDGRLAFVDTEHWDRHGRKYLRHIHKYLSNDRRERAEEIFDELEDDYG